MAPSVLAAAAAAAVFAQPAAALEAIALQERGDGTRVFVDAQGRQRIFHGTNVVVKGPPWHPDVRTFSKDISMAEQDFQVMKSWGLNMIRLGVMWPGVEPVRGQYNETYLDELEGVVDLAAAHGVYTLLDMHQDGLSERYCGEGLPVWAVNHTKRKWIDKIEDWAFDGEPFPSPFSHFDEKTDYYTETRLAGSPRLPTAKACRTHNLGPGWHEVCKESANSYQALYSNIDGVADAWAAMWAKVASRFAKKPAVLGLELINEPFAGDLYHDPLIMAPYPNPHNADAVNLQPAYDRINSAVRDVSQDVLLFFGGVTWADLGSGFSAAPGGRSFANRSVLAYHFYRPPQKSAWVHVKAMHHTAARLATGSFLTETEAPGSPNMNEPYFRSPGGLGDDADAALQSWAGWEWKSFCRGQSDVSQFGEFGACKTGYGTDWSDDGKPPEHFEDAHARTYARAVAGKTVSMYFNVTSGSFKLEYEVVDPVSQAPTEIFFLTSRYPGGIEVQAHADRGSVSVKQDSEGLVHILPAPGLVAGAHVVVTLVAKTSATELII